MSVDGEVFPLGTWVVLQTRLGQQLEGEVLSFDPSSSVIVLKVKSEDDNPRNCQVNLGTISIFQYIYCTVLYSRELIGSCFGPQNRETQ